MAVVWKNLPLSCIVLGAMVLMGNLESFAVARRFSRVDFGSCVKARSMPDDMYFAPNERSLYRGKRAAPRTDTCRPCLMQTVDDEALTIKGVILDINPYGMMVRAIECVAVGTKVTLQLMRDEHFQEPFSAVLHGRVVRHLGTVGTFTDHGIRLNQDEGRSPESKPIKIEAKRRPTAKKITRMHTVDYTVGSPPRSDTKR